MSHPVDSVLVDDVEVAKSNFRTFEKSRNSLVLNGQTEAGAMSLAGVYAIQDRTSGITFVLDPASVLPASADIIVSADGFRFKRITEIASLTAAQIANILQANGGLPLSGIAPGGANTFVGTTTGVLAHQPATALPGLIDAGLGNTEWRQNISSVTSGGLVASLPSNARRSGGGLTRLWLMTDGLIQASGAVSGGVNGDAGGASVSRPQSIPHPLGLRWTKVWSHNTAAYALDEQNRLYSWGAGHQVLGHGDTTARNRPTLIAYFVTNSLTVVDVILAFSGGTVTNTVDVLFLCTNGKLYYAGANGSAQAGIGNIAAQATPVEWANGALTGTIVGACIADELPTIYAWNSARTARCAGDGSYGQRGDGVTTAPPGNLSVTIALSNVTKIVACSRGALAMHNTTGSGSQASYAGINSSGEGGQNATTPANLTTWTIVSALGSTVKDIEIGGSRSPTCGAISMTNRLRLWGANSNGQQGNGGTANVIVPTEPSGAWQGFVDSFAVASQTGFCGVIIQVSDTTPRLLAAGINSRAQLSVGVATNPVTTFSQVMGLPPGATIQQWAVHGTTDLWGITVRTTAGTFSGGYGGDGQNGIGDARNLHILQRPDFPALAGATGSPGSSGASSPAIISNRHTSPSEFQTIADGASMAAGLESAREWCRARGGGTVHMDSRFEPTLPTMVRWDVDNTRIIPTGKEWRVARNSLLEGAGFIEVRGLTIPVKNVQIIGARGVHYNSTVTIYTTTAAQAFYTYDTSGSVPPYDINDQIQYVVVRGTGTSAVILDAYLAYTVEATGIRLSAGVASTITAGETIRIGRTSASHRQCFLLSEGVSAALPNENIKFSDVYFDGGGVSDQGVVMLYNRRSSLHVREVRGCINRSVYDYGLNDDAKFDIELLRSTPGIGPLTDAMVGSYAYDANHFDTSNTGRRQRVAIHNVEPGFLRGPSFFGDQSDSTVSVLCAAGARNLNLLIQELSGIATIPPHFGDVTLRSGAINNCWSMVSKITFAKLKSIGGGSSASPALRFDQGSVGSAETDLTITEGSIEAAVGDGLALSNFYKGRVNLTISSCGRDGLISDGNQLMNMSITSHNNGRWGYNTANNPARNTVTVTLYSNGGSGAGGNLNASGVGLNVYNGVSYAPGGPTNVTIGASNLQANLITS
jgi:hypothetical protein